MNEQDLNRFKHLKFEDFKHLATDNTLTVNQKIGFPEQYRADKDQLIFDDIFNKLNFWNTTANQIVLDIGAGCSNLAHLIINHCRLQNNKLILVDHKEMLDQLPNGVFIEKYFGYFPTDLTNMLNTYHLKVNKIICYSIFHYVYQQSCIFQFLDNALSLLAPGGVLLLADLPNQSKRNRFFKSIEGIKYHQAYTNSNTLPPINELSIDEPIIDDGIIFGILLRYRNAGFDTYLVPQSVNLPMANRREDILIYKN
jgi:cyclopropane fatty-acyl-phospholipid synthase-like methyltransferase